MCCTKHICAVSSLWRFYVLPVPQTCLKFSAINSDCSPIRKLREDWSFSPLVRNSLFRVLGYSGSTRSQVQRVVDAFWRCGLSSPLHVTWNYTGFSHMPHEVQLWQVLSSQILFCEPLTSSNKKDTLLLVLLPHYYLAHPNIFGMPVAWVERSSRTGTSFWDLKVLRYFS